MRHLLVDLDNQLKTLLLEDNVILDFHKIPFDKNAFGKVNKMIEGFNPTKLTFITHNVLSTCLYKDACVAFSLDGVEGEVLSLISSEDVSALLRIAGKNGLDDVSLVDKAGYYASFQNNEVCYVEKYLGLYRLYCFDATGVKYCICTEATLEEQQKKFMEKNSLTTVQKTEELSDVGNLMYFMNSVMLLDDDAMVQDLSVFAYACMENGVYRYSFDVRERSTENIACAEFRDVPCAEVSSEAPNPGIDDSVPSVDDLTILDLAEDDESVEDTKPKHKAKRQVKQQQQQRTVNEVVKGARDNSARKAISNVVFALGVVGVLLTGATYLYNTQYGSKEVQNANKQLEANQSMVNSISNTLSIYNKLLAAKENAAIGMYASVSSSITENKGVLLNLEGTAESSSMSVKFEDEDNCDAFVEACSAAGFTTSKEKIEDSSATENEPEKESEDNENTKKSKTKGKSADSEESAHFKVIVTNQQPASENNTLQEDNT